MAITPEQYMMTQAELSGGSAGQAAYTKRIADLRAAESATPTTPTTPTIPATPKPTTTPQAPQAPQAPTPVASTTPPPAYRIQSGDTLSAIAARQGTTIAALLAANPQIKDPNKIFAGQSLNLPGTGITTPSAPTTPTTPPVAPPTAPKAPTTPTTGGLTVPTGDEIATMTEEQKIQVAQDLASQGIPWDMVQSYLNSQTPTLDPNKYWEDAQAKYGLEDLENKINTNPTQTFEEIVTSVYGTLGLSSLKTDIDDLRGKIAKAEKDRDEAMETVNDNPWLTEASRVGRVSRINDKAQNELNRLQNQLTLTETLYTRGQDEAKDVATRALAEFDKQRSYDIEELNRLNERAVAEAQANYELAQGEATKESFRYFPDYAGAMPTEATKKDTQIIEANGRKLLVDTQTGQIIKDLGASSVADTSGTTGEEGMSAYQLERSKRTISAVDDLLGRVGDKTVGVGSLLSIIPGSQAKDFEADLATLKSNIAFGELTAMREASKTGGALGQVSDREGKLLESALGALDTKQSPENFTKNLKKIKDSVQRWLDEVAKSSTTGVADPLGVLGEGGASGADPLGLGL